ncbi:MAG: hypothetical protein IJT07_00255 [Oscillospiraceae bacterium]|nr:hypothetical protein [Oscillospiraceae bacterium]
MNEDTYLSWKEFAYYVLDDINPTCGRDAQEFFLYQMDEDSLTERERLFAILSAISYELDHDMLTQELKGELRYYYAQYKNGNLATLLNKDEREEVQNELLNFYQKVFGTN